MEDALTKTLRYWRTSLADGALETLDYSTRWKPYRICVNEKDIKVHEQLFRDLIKLSRDHRDG